MHKSLALKEPCIHDIPFFLTVNKKYQARPLTAAVILKQLKIPFHGSPIDYQIIPARLCA